MVKKVCFQQMLKNADLMVDAKELRDGSQCFIARCYYLNPAGVQEMQESHAQSRFAARQESTHAPSKRQLVKLSNAQMLALIADEQLLFAKIREYNRRGIDLINNEELEEALAYLLQSENILEYAASCGKTIERSLINCILHNEACAYQKLWELEKSCDYMEALLYNQKAYLDQSSQVEIPHALRDRQPQSKPLSDYVRARTEAVIYQLQYSAVNSQISKHEVAISSAKKALAYLHEILSMQSEYECHTKGTNKNPKVRLLRQECRGINKQVMGSLVSRIQSAFASVLSSQRCGGKEMSGVKKFTISQVMQLEPLALERAQKPRLVETTMCGEGFYELAYYVSIAYYALATELRLMSSTAGSQKKSRELEKSRIYHLNSIRIAIEYVPCISEYTAHINKSFKNNYGLGFINHEHPECVKVPESGEQVWKLFQDESLFINESEVSDRAHHAHHDHHDYHGEYTGSQLLPYTQVELVESKKGLLPNTLHMHRTSSTANLASKSRTSVSKMTSRSRKEKEHEASPASNRNTKMHKARGLKTTKASMINAGPNRHSSSTKSHLVGSKSKSTSKLIRVPSKKISAWGNHEKVGSSQKTKDQSKPDEKKQKHKKKVNEEYNMGLKTRASGVRKEKTSSSRKKNLKTSIPKGK